MAKISRRTDPCALAAAERVVVPAADGWRLGATLYRSARRGETRVALVLPAMGVGQRRYRRFARFLAGEGWTVLTFDYRGIGASREGAAGAAEPTIFAWGELDLAAAIDWIDEHLCPARIVAVAHSIGGHVVAFAPNRDRISAVLAVATPKPYWRLWRGPLQLGIYAFFHAMIPGAVALFGRLPLRLAGLDDLPARVALDWIRVSLGEGDRDDRGGPLRARFAGFRAPVLSLSFGDDFLYAPRRAVEYLMDQYFVDAPTVQCHVEPAEHGLDTVGHSGFFGAGVPVDWWRGVSRWLTDAPASPPRFGAARWRGSCSITPHARADARGLDGSSREEAPRWL